VNFEGILSVLQVVVNFEFDYWVLVTQRVSEALVLLKNMIDGRWFMSWFFKWKCLFLTIQVVKKMWNLLSLAHPDSKNERLREFWIQVTQLWGNIES